MGNPLTNKKPFGVRLQEFYTEFKSRQVKYGGFYIGPTPCLLAVDTDIIKTILSKDFQYFSSQGTGVDPEQDTLSANLFHIYGEPWKAMRSKLTPAFTSGKLRMMFPILLNCGEQLQHFTHENTIAGKPLDLKLISNCYNADVMGSCAFGLDCNSFKTPNSEFIKAGSNVFAPSLRMLLRLFLNVISPTLVQLLKLPFIPKESSDFFLGAVTNVVKYREDTKRNDFMQIFMDIRKSEDFTLEQMTAEAIGFFLGGFETSSTALTFCLYELAYHQDIQDKIRLEIAQVLNNHDDKLTYDGVMEMKYIEQVIKGELLLNTLLIKILNKKVNVKVQNENSYYRG